MDEGPDIVLPTDALLTWKQDGYVKIRKTTEPPGDIEPKSLVTFLKTQCEKGGEHLALAVKRDDQWKKWTYTQYFKDIQSVAKGFLHHGLEHHNGVAIWGFNSPEWFIADLAAIYAGGVVVGLYPTNSNSVNKFILNDSRSNILVVEDSKGVETILTFRNELPALKKIVQYTGTPARHPDVISWQDLIELGRNKGEGALSERHKKMAINHCATLVYTSGTTGMPKGVMLSHDNIYWMGLSAAKFIHMRDFEEVMISYLPLSHVAANMVDIWSPICCLGTIYFADKMALKGTLLKTLKEVRPTIFLGVPRVWEKIMEGMMDKGKNVKGLKKKVADACKKAGLQHHLDGKDSLLFTMGQKVIYKKVREALGLDRCVLFFSGAAPISIDTLKYFLSLDVVILELYGLSETNGPQTLSYYGSHYKIGSCGKTLRGTKTKMKDTNDRGEGEVCMWGRNVMMGYLNRKDETLATFDDEGYFCSGDLAIMDENGFLSITGRIKELLITAGGENVPPCLVEDAIKRELPCISNAILIGDKRKFITAFLTFRVVMDVETEAPTTQLIPSCVAWCKSIGSDSNTVDDILLKPDGKVLAAIQEGIDRANKDAPSNAAKVQRWTILPMDVSVAGGELGPTLKLKRFAFNKKYEEAIEKLYE